MEAFNANSAAITGWVPDLPDFRDWDFDSEKAADINRYISSFDVQWPDVDLRDEFLFVPASNPRHASAAACCRLVEFFRRKCDGETIYLSDIFVHHVSALLEGKPASEQTSLRA